MEINASVATADGAFVDPRNLAPQQSQDLESEATRGEEGELLFIFRHSYFNSIISTSKIWPHSICFCKFFLGKKIGIFMGNCSF